MKVLHISEYCHAESIGGTERYVQALIEGLTPHGIESCIGWLTSAPRAPFEAAGVSVYPLPAAAMRVDAPPTGLTAQAFPTLRERWEFTMTPQYAEIYRMLGDLIHKFRVASGARPHLSHEQSARMQRQEGRERTP